MEPDCYDTGRDQVFCLRLLLGNFNNRILIDAGISYHRKLRGVFLKVVEVPQNMRAQLIQWFSQIIKTGS